jgi:hypothetical protein
MNINVFTLALNILFIIKKAESIHKRTAPFSAGVHTDRKKSMLSLKQSTALQRNSTRCTVKEFLVRIIKKRVKTCGVIAQNNSV